MAKSTDANPPVPVGNGRVPAPDMSYTVGASTQTHFTRSLTLQDITQSYLWCRCLNLLNGVPDAVWQTGREIIDNNRMAITVAHVTKALVLTPDDAEFVTQLNTIIESMRARDKFISLYAPQSNSVFDSVLLAFYQSFLRQVALFAYDRLASTPGPMPHSNAYLNRSRVGLSVADVVRLIDDTNSVTQIDTSWLTSTVVAIAKGIAITADNSAMPILADALEEAGCDREPLLIALRDTSAHVGMSPGGRIIYGILTAASAWSWVALAEWPRISILRDLGNRG